MPRKVSLETQRQVYQRIDAGYSIRDAAKYCGVSPTYVQNLLKQERASGGRDRKNEKVELTLSEPLAYDQLSPIAQRCWDDFGMFQERYFGRVPQTWQVEAAGRAVELLQTDREEYLLVNAPPGSGKSLLFAHDLPVWLTIRNRAIRGQMGSITSPTAARYNGRIRTTLERVQPVTAKLQDLQNGWAKDALATVSQDYGRFRPLERDRWTREGFVVLQHGGMAVVEKEDTWQSYGIDAGFIGGRFDLVIWDDLVDPKKHRTEEARRQLERDYDDLCETRLDPHGLLILQGQRLFPDDLYRYNLDKTEPEFIDAAGVAVGKRPKYVHIKYPAHFVDKCSEGSHAKDPPDYAHGGCLLAPTRLPYYKLAGLKENNPNFETVYQQEDTDPRNVLVPNNWVYGDASHIGCVDKHREYMEIPGQGQMTGFVSVLTVDPSPTQYWAIEWWLVHPESQQYFLMDLVKKRMEAPDFLGYNIDERHHYGVAYDIVERSKEMGVPITHLIIESNVAQRFLSQYDHFKTWLRLNNLVFIPHQTNKNKADPEYGVETIAPFWEFGHVRLPFKGNYARGMSLQIIKEVTHYAGDPPDDAIMAEWFLHWNWHLIYTPAHDPHRMWRPSWMTNNSKPSRGQIALFQGKNTLSSVGGR